MKPPDTRALEGQTSPGILANISALLDQTWSAHPEIPVAVCTQMSIATCEIAANIVEHAARGLPVYIRIEVRVLPHEVHVEFTDAGQHAQIDLAAAALPDPMAERGRGLALAKSALAELAYTKSTAAHSTTNHWRLVSKRFG